MACIDWSTPRIQTLKISPRIGAWRNKPTTRWQLKHEKTIPPPVHLKKHMVGMWCSCSQLFGILSPRWSPPETLTREAFADHPPQSDCRSPRFPLTLSRHGLSCNNVECLDICRSIFILSFAAYWCWSWARQVLPAPCGIMTTSTSKNAFSKTSQDLCSDTKDKGSSGGGNEANAEASKPIQGFRLVLLFVGLALSVFCLSLVCISEFISTFLFTRTYTDVFGFGRIVQSWLRPFRELRPSLIPLTTWRGTAPLTCYPRVVFSFLLESCTRSSRYGACSLRRWVFSSWDHSSAQ